MRTAQSLPRAARTALALLLLACVALRGAAAQYDCDFSVVQDCQEEQIASGAIANDCLYDYNACTCREVAIANACSVRGDCFGEGNQVSGEAQRPECDASTCDGTFDLDDIEVPTAKGAVHLDDDIALILLPVVVGLVAAAMVAFALYKGDLGLPALVTGLVSGFCGIIFLILGVIPRKVPMEKYEEDDIQVFDVSSDETPIAARVYLFSGPTLGASVPLLFVSAICFIVYSANKAKTNGTRV